MFKHRAAMSSLAKIVPKMEELQRALKNELDRWSGTGGKMAKKIAALLVDIDTLANLAGGRELQGIRFLLPDQGRDHVPPAEVLPREAPPYTSD